MSERKTGCPVLQGTGVSGLFPYSFTDGVPYRQLYGCLIRKTVLQEYLFLKCVLEFYVEEREGLNCRYGFLSRRERPEGSGSRMVHMYGETYDIE